MQLHLYSSFARFLLGILALGFALAAAAAGPKAYVGNFKDDSVSVIDTSAGTVIATIPVAKGPHGMSVTPDGRLAVSAGWDNTVRVWVIATGECLAVYPAGARVAYAWAANVTDRLHAIPLDRVDLRHGRYETSASVCSARSCPHAAAMSTPRE